MTSGRCSPRRRGRGQLGPRAASSVSHMTRLATLALADGSTVAARHDGESFHAFRDLLGERYGDVGALLRAGLETATIEDGVVEGRLLRPVLQPGAVACVGINYGAHIAEMGRE